MPKIAPRWKKIILYSLSSIIILLIAIWGILYWYVSTHKQELIAKIETAAGEKIEGKVIIKDIQPDFFKDFPLMSFRIDSVSLQDSLYSTHHIKLLEVEHAYARLNFFSVLKGSPSFSKITIENGHFNIFVDSSGYSNNYLLRSKDTTDKKKNKKGMEISDFEINNFSLSIDNKPMDKKFAFTVNKLQGNYATTKTGTMIKFFVEAGFKQLGFNLELGSFLKNSTIKGDFKVAFDTAAKTFKIQKTPLDIDGETVYYEASLSLDKEKDIPFRMNFEAKNVNYNVGVNWLSENIYNKLSKLKFKKPLNLYAQINGGFMERGTNPHITLQYDTKDNVVDLMGYSFDKVFFKGRFDNEVIKGIARHDSNSVVTLDTLSADFSSLPVRGKNISLTNLKHPFAKAELAASFNANGLNNIFGEQFNFSKGTCSYNLRYNGELFLNTLIADEIYGDVNLNNVDFVYQDRNLRFTRGNVILKFNGNDLGINKFQVFSNNSDINITGLSKDFLTAFMQLPGKAMMDLKLKSNNIDFGAFETYFIQKRTNKTPVSTGTAIKTASSKLEDFLTNSSVTLNMDINKAVYKKLQISNFNALMLFREAGINIDHLNLRAADGSISLKAGINQSAPNNPFFASVNVNNVKVDKFFYAFNNFGFKGLTDKNVEGLFSVNGDLKGNITDRGTILENTLDGKLNYKLTNAALKNFGFFDKIKRFFRNRKLEQLEIPHFAGSVSISNGTITIPQTKLETSALNLSFVGKYGVGSGRPTAIDLRVPLRNPQIDKKREEEGRKKRKGEGIVLNFKATSDKEGKINIGIGKTEGAKDEGMDWSEEEE
ncbi:MAG: hypothetical protein BGO31_07820 [Bacteroidetes bacterium 43-16]|nr:MAG: hypothetical protein BGO31_07820 [Bacteroidetes bacterium 43-16]